MILAEMWPVQIRDLTDSGSYDVLTALNAVFLASVRLWPMKTKPRMMLATLATSDV